MKVTVKKKDAPKELAIETEFIKLEAALKYACYYKLSYSFIYYLK